MSPVLPTRRKKDYFLPFLIIIAIGVIAALLIRLLGLMSEDEDSGLSLSGQAQLSGISGGVEVYLPAAKAWKITQTDTKLNAGENVRTDADGSAVLTFDDGSVLNLGNSSELNIDVLQNSITKKEVQLSLEKGAAWVEVGSMNADFEIAGAFLRIKDADGKFLLQTDAEENTASALGGGFVAVLLDPQNENNPELENFVVEAGETIEISERRINLIRIGGEIDLVKATPIEISSSKIYLAAMGGESLDTSETAGDELNPDEVTTDAERDTLPAPLITTGNGNITAVTDPVKVSGKVSPKIEKVAVAFEDDEPFALSQFKAGSGEWSYNAALDYGNLKVGINNYTVVGTDADGNETPPANFQINFNPEGVEEEATTEEDSSESTEIANVDGVPEAGSTTFAAPVVSQPADGATFTEAPIRLEGTVPEGTKQVLVNEYALSRFEAGSTSWYYNADPKYENLKIGENEFEIVAVSETGDRSSVTIKITYQPEGE